MPVIYYDGFDDCSGTTDLATKGWNTNIYSMGTSTSRFNSGTYLQLGGSTAFFFERSFVGVSDLIIGLAYSNSAVNNSWPGQTTQFLSFINGSTTLYTVAYVGNTNLLGLYDSNNNLLITNNFMLIGQGNVWQYIEFRLHLTGTTTYFEIVINGTSVYSNTFTITNTLTTITKAHFRSPSSGFGATLYDDIYFVDNSDSIGFLGNVRIPYLKPASDSSIVFTRSTGSTSFNLVADNPSNDGDSSYVTSSTPGDKDLYGVTSLGYTPTSIMGIRQEVFGRATDYTNLKPIIKTGGTETTGSLFNIPIGGTYSGFLGSIYLINPVTSLAWTTSDLSALTFGYISTYLDPFWANTTLLLHGDGSNGSTTITDSSTSATSFTNIGVVVNTAQSKFGGSSLAFQQNYITDTRYSTQILSLSPILYLKLNESSGTTATDSSGNSYSGTYTATGITYSATPVISSSTDTSITFNGSTGGITDSQSALNVIGNANQSFTFECWTRFTSTASGSILIDKTLNSSSSSVSLSINAGTTALFGVSNSTFGVASVSGGGSINDGLIHHVVGVRDATNNLLILYVDGQLAQSTTLAGTLVFSNINPLSIGYRNISGTITLPFAGSIGQAAVYTTALTAAQVQSNFLAGYEPSTIVAPASANWNLGVGDWTIEGWYYMTATSTNTFLWQIGTDTTHRVGLYCSTFTGQFYSQNIGLNNIGIGTILSLNTWTHIAVTRQGNTIRYFVNGTLFGTTSSFTDIINSNSCTLCLGGNQFNGTAKEYFKGFIDDFRVTTGLARYTATFTLPNQAFPSAG